MAEKKKSAGIALIEKIERRGPLAYVLIAASCALGVAAVLAFVTFSGFGGAADFVYNQF